MNYPIQILTDKLNEVEFTRSLLFKEDLSNKIEIDKIDKRITEIKQSIFVLSFLYNNSLDITLDKDNNVLLNDKKIKRGYSLK